MGQNTAEAMLAERAAHAVQMALELEHGGGGGGSGHHPRTLTNRPVIEEQHYLPTGTVELQLQSVGQQQQQQSVSGEMATGAAAYYGRSGVRSSGKTPQLRPQHSRQYSIDHDDFEEEEAALFHGLAEDELLPPELELEGCHHHEEVVDAEGEEEEDRRLALRRKMYSKQIFGHVNMDGYASRFGQYRPYLHNYGSRRRYRPRPPNIERSNTEPASQTLQPFSLLSPSVSPHGGGAGGMADGGGGNGGFQPGDCLGNPAMANYGNSSSASSLLLMMMNSQHHLAAGSQGSHTPTSAQAAAASGGALGYGSYGAPPHGHHSSGHHFGQADYANGSTSSISSTSTGVSMHLHPQSAAGPAALSSRLLPQQPKLSQVGTRGRYIFSSQSVDECSTGLGEADLVAMMNRSSLNDCDNLPGTLKSTYIAGYERGGEGGGGGGSSAGNTAATSSSNTPASHHSKRQAFGQSSYSIDVPDRVSLYVPETCASTSPSMPLNPSAYNFDNRRLSPVYGVDGMLLAGVAGRPGSGGSGGCNTFGRRSNRAGGSGRFSKQLSLTNAAAAAGSHSCSPVEKTDEATADIELYCPVTGSPYISQGSSNSGGGGGGTSAATGSSAHRLQRVSRRRLPTIKSLPLITDPLAEPADSATSSPSNSYSYYVSQLSANTSPNHSYVNIAQQQQHQQHQHQQQQHQQQHHHHHHHQQQQHQQQHCSPATGARHYSSAVYGSSHSPVPPHHPGSASPSVTQYNQTGATAATTALAVPSLRLTHSFGSSTELSTSLSRSPAGGSGGRNSSPINTAAAAAAAATTTAGGGAAAHCHQSHLAAPPGVATSAQGGRDRHSLSSSSSYRLHDMHKQYSLDHADLSRHTPLYADLSEELLMMQQRQQPQLQHGTLTAATDTEQTQTNRSLGRHSSWRNRTPETMAHLSAASAVSPSSWSPKSSPKNSNHHHSNANANNSNSSNKSPQFARHSPQSANYLRRLPLPSSNYLWRSI